MPIPQGLRDAAENVRVGIVACAKAAYEAWLTLDPSTRSIIKALSLGFIIGFSTCAFWRLRG